MTKVLTWYCPLDGLEHRSLILAGWKKMHTLYVDGVLWVKMRKTEDSILVADVILLHHPEWVN